MKLNIIFNLLTMSSAIAALFLESNEQVKIIAIIIAIISGLTSLIISIENHQQTEYFKGMSESIIKCMSPKSEMIEFIRQTVIPVITGKESTGRSIWLRNGDFVFLYENEKNRTDIDFAVFIESGDIMRLYVTPDKILKKKINETFMSKWTKDESIETDWNIIISKIASYCAAALGALEYSQYYDHLAFDINYHEKILGIIFYDENDSIIFKLELCNEDELRAFLKIKPIDRFFYILDILNAAIKDGIKWGQK
ncbi:hypothetical protein CPJCM30710_20330 [Clostridium polyendosporum]|uniref:DUF3137 domain-containing protein n=1 Tax=Clostridium polyendosporum TaxID=69208 RepID=A0A919RZK2_9CLOT|nr:hypothetical protein [Clostridium polyendosporum]GIM29367.1 hypothetical protein CPJCM30710_20330 [Clostridium polyendosporum]